MLAAVNADRAAAGVAPVVWDQRLADSAQAWSEHMAAVNLGYHNGSGADNIIGRWPCNNATELEAAWMASRGHRDQILYSGYTRIGFGSTVNGLGLWAVQQFGI